MKMNIKSLLPIVVVTFILMSVFSAFGLIALPFLVGGGSLAMAEITDSPVDTENVTTASSELLAQTISKKITEMRPSSVPLDTILRNMSNAVKAPSWKYEFYSVDTRDIEDTLALAYTTAAAGTYSSTSGEHTLQVTNITQWQVDDNFMIQGSTGSDSKEIVCHIVAKTTASSTIKVLPLNGTGVGGYDLPDMASGQKITRIGNAKSQLDAQTSPYAQVPTKAWNYSQIHMSQVEEGLYEALHTKEVQWGLMDYKAQSIYDLRRSMELTSLFGVRSKKTDPEDADSKYFSGGILRYATGAISYKTALFDDDSWINWSKDVFQGNSGSDRRVVFAGSTLIATISKAASVSRQLDAKNTEIVHGIRFRRVETNFGELLIKKHDLFDECGYAKNGFILDLNNLDKYTYKPLQTTKLELIKSGTRKSNAFVLDEAFGVATRYPATHTVITCSDA